MRFSRSMLSAVIAGLLLFPLRSLVAGPFAGSGGSDDEPKISYDSAAIAGWASGWLNYQVGANCDAAFQTPDKALGAAGGTEDEIIYDIVSLGEGGRITLTFPNSIIDGDGWDFAIFENSFSESFLEFAYVEVSSDNVTYVRFDNCSLTESGVSGYGTVDASNVRGLAGKYRGGFGQGFDLKELENKPEVTSGAVCLSDIRYVRVIDVIGDGSCYDHRTDEWVDAYGENGPIYDPYPSSLSAGFDLNAIGVRYFAKAGIAVSPTALSVNEAGGTATFMVSLTSRPTGGVVLKVAPSVAGLVDISPKTPAFSSTSSLSQTVTITGVDNAQSGDQSLTLSVYVHAAPDDPEYTAVPTKTVAVTVLNDDFSLTTRAGSGGTVSPAGTRTLSAADLPFSVTAAPNAGLAFHDWIDASDGTVFSTDNPLKISEMDRDLSLIATFGAPRYEVRFIARSGGLVNGQKQVVQTIVEGDDCATVTATASQGYLFDGWTGDYVGTEATLTIKNVTSDMTIYADFEKKTYRVVFRTDGTSGATLSGDVDQEVAYGDYCSAVTAVVPDGGAFAGWAGGYVGTDNPLTLGPITGDLTVVANFEVGFLLTVGSVFDAPLDAVVEVLPPNDAFFASARIIGTNADGTRKMATRKLAAINRNTDCPALRCRWDRKIRLYDPKAARRAEALGTSLKTWLAKTGSQQALSLDLAVAANTLSLPVAVGTARIVPPRIDQAYYATNGALVLEGRWFGNGALTVWAETVMPDGAIKRTRLKVLPSTDAAGSAVMDAATGESRVLVQRPATPKKGKLNGILALDNGLGLAVIQTP